MTSVFTHQAQKLGASLPSLLLEADRVAQTVWQGVHGRRRAGVGESFWQFRRYEQGDTTDRIDWRQSARTDKIFIREREWEAAQSAFLWADRSGSMHYASRKDLPQKVERAQLLMLALAALLLRGSEKVTWLDERRAISVQGKTGLERIAARLGTSKAMTSFPPDFPVGRYAHMVLCSDFLTPEEDLQKKMRHYTSLHLRGVLVHILDPAEETFPLDGRVEVEDGENQGSLLLPNAASFRASYLARMEEHKARLARYAESAGWFLVQHVTNELPHLPLVRLYQYLAADR